jgi:hypothetical protein
MDAIMLSMLAWLNLHTEYEVSLQLPNIAIVEDNNLCRLYGIHDRDYCKSLKLKGFYNESHTIFLHGNFNVTDRQDQARLLHELVHYVQWANGEHVDGCRGLLEVEAYELQDEWRSQQGIAQQTDPFKLIMLEASCEA